MSRNDFLSTLKRRVQLAERDPASAFYRDEFLGNRAEAIIRLVEAAQGHRDYESSFGGPHECSLCEALAALEEK